jgi:hypothetical protein
MRTTIKVRLGLTTTLALSCLSGSLLADAELMELPRTWEQLPQSVALTLEQALGGHEAEEIEEILFEGVPVLYEAEYKLGGLEVDIAIFPNGELAARTQELDDDDADDDAYDGDDGDDEELSEREISFSELPDAARQVLSRLLGGQQPEEIEAIAFEGIVVLYEVEVVWRGEVDDADDDDDDDETQARRLEFFLYPDGGLAVPEGEIVERQVELDEVPLLVADALRYHLGDANATEIEEVRCEGLPILYEAEFLVDGEEYDVAVLPNGTLANRGSDDDEPYDGLREREIDLAEAPPAVAATIRKHFGDAVLEIDEIAYEGVVVLYDAENGRLEISVYPDGELAIVLPDSGDDDDGDDIDDDGDDDGDNDNDNDNDNDHDDDDDD